MMKKNFTRILFTAVLLFGLQLFAQDDLDSEKSNIQTYTPSKLLNKGDWDFKIFNNLREKARKRRHYDDYSDCWQQLLITFTGFAEGQKALAQPALGGLFTIEQCPDL